MHKKNLYKRKGLNVFRVDKISNLEIKNFIDPEFTLKTNKGGILTETGLLVVFSIEPSKDKNLPSFVARWDQNNETLDIDIANVEENIKAIFKAERGGYHGHHPKRILKTTRTFKVDIKIPDKDIFTGNVTFNINHGHEPGLFS